MNPTLYNKALANGLNEVDYIEWQQEDRDLATLRALQAYSQYNPIKRRYSQSTLYEPYLTAMGSDIYIVGSIWFAQDQFTITDIISGATETATVSSIALAPYDLTLSLPVTKLTLSAPLVHNYNQGSLLQKSPPPGFAPNVSGLVLNANQDTYYLPLDFISFEQESFDLAVGKKSTRESKVSYYDDAYGMSMRLSGIGSGMSSNFASSYLAGGTPFNAFPMNVAGSPVAGGLNFPTEVAYTVLNGFPPLLIVQPAPSTQSILDVFYYGMHSVSSVSAFDLDAVVSYALYSAFSSAAISENLSGDISFSTFKVSGSTAARELNELANNHLNEFKRRIANRPVAMTG